MNKIALGLLVFLLFSSCVSQEEKKKVYIDESRLKWKNWINLEVDRWNDIPINWSYLKNKDTYIVGFSNTSFNEYKSNKNFPLNRKVPIEGFFKNIGAITLSEGTFELYIQANERYFKKDYSNVDPFEKQNIINQDLDFVNHNVYFNFTSNFNITNYDLSKELYRITLSDETIAELKDDEDGDFLLRSLAIPGYNYTLEFKSEIVIPLPKEKAKKMRDMNVYILWHAKILKPKSIKYTDKNCINRNQFAPDGCLEWNKTQSEHYFHPIELHQVSIIGYDNSSSDQFEVLDYKFIKNKPILSFK